MICKECGTPVNAQMTFCPKCGTRLDSPEYLQKDISDNPNDTSDNQSANPQKRNIKLIILAFILAVSAIIAGGVVLHNHFEAKELRDAVASRDGEYVYSVYSERYDNKAVRKRYDKVIADTIDEISADLADQNFDEDAKNIGARACLEWKETWGSLLDQNTLSLKDCIHAQNTAKWKALTDDLEAAEYYCEGIQLLQQADYSNAIKSLSGISSQASYAEKASAKIEESIQAYIETTLSAVDQQIDAGDINAGLELLNTTISELEEYNVDINILQQKADETLRSYAETYIQKAEREFAEHDIVAAIGNLEVAVKLQPGNADYKTKLATYQLYLPYALYDGNNILNRQKMCITAEYDDSEISNDNKEYQNLIDFYYDEGDSGELAEYTYNLSGKYDNVKGTLFIHQRHKSDNQSAYFEAYGDGKLLYTSPSVGPGVLPQDIAFNVSGVQTLVLKYYGKTTSFWGTGFAVSELVAQKAFPQ